MSGLSLPVLGPFAVSLNQRPITEFRTKIVQTLPVHPACNPYQVHQRLELGVTTFNQLISFDPIRAVAL